MKYLFDCPEMPNFRFEIINEWFQKQFRNEQGVLLPQFLELNKKFPVGKEREEAYIKLMEEHIEKVGLLQVGLLAKYVQETEGKAERAETMWNAHIEKIEKFHEDHSNFIHQMTNGQLLNS